jgi:hypothetical protein
MSSSHFIDPCHASQVISNNCLPLRPSEISLLCEVQQKAMSRMQVFGSGMVMILMMMIMLFVM